MNILRGRCFIIWGGIVCLFCVCEEAPFETNESLGFVVTSYGNNDSIRLEIDCNSYPDTLPVVTFNNQYLRPQIYQGIYWGRGYYPWGVPLTYQITWKGDTLQYTFVPPAPIDAFFCNDRCLRNGSNDIISSDSGFALRWKIKGVPKDTMYYYLNVSYGNSDSSGIVSFFNIDTVLTGTTFFIPAMQGSKPVTYLEMHFGVLLSMWPEDAGCIPSVTSPGGKLYCYHKIEGPSLWLHVNYPNW